MASWLMTASGNDLQSLSTELTRMDEEWNGVLAGEHPDLPAPKTKDLGIPIRQRMNTVRQIIRTVEWAKDQVSPLDYLTEQPELR